MPQDKPPKTVEALVLCVDRDDDLGRKASVRGPVIGEEDNFRAARALGMADPEDTDMNAIIAAVKTKRESEHLYNGVEIVTLTGDKDVGVISDQKIGNQLDNILETYKPKGVILVTDGEEDEEILPLLQSRTKILSVKSITVKQARQLESAYFKLQEFFGRVGENPRQARMMFGLPGLLILLIVLLSYFGIPIVQVLLAVISLYLIAKGFGYEEQLFAGLGEVKNSLTEGKIHKVFNVVAIAMIVLSLVAGYLQLHENLDAMYIRPSLEVNPRGVVEALTTQPIMALNFALLSSTGTNFSALDLILVAISLMSIGFILHNFLIRNYLGIKRYAYIMIFVVLVKYIANSAYWAVLYLQRNLTPIQVTSFDPVQALLVEALVSFIALVVVHYLLKIVFFDYLAKKKQLEKNYLGMEVVSKKGEKLGKVTKVSMRGTELIGVNVKRKYYPMDELNIKGTSIMVGQ